jgi:hypothetical protein
MGFIPLVLRRKNEYLDHAHRFKYINKLLIILPLCEDLNNMITAYIMNEEYIYSAIISLIISGYLDGVIYIHEKYSLNLNKKIFVKTIVNKDYCFIETLIELAARFSHFKIFKYLHKNGADIDDFKSNNINRIYNMYDYEKLQRIYTSATKSGCLKIVKYINKKFPCKCTSIIKNCYCHLHNDEQIHTAIKYGHLNIIKYFQKSHNIITTSSEENANQYTIITAARYGQLEIVKYLHENGADIKVCNNHAINTASYYRHGDVVRYLRYHGAHKRRRY